MADLHIGDPHSDMPLIKRRINHIGETPNAYGLLNGDLLNNATKTSVSDSYAETLTPMQQIDLIINIISPIKEKVFAIMDGNHCYRTYRKEGIDIMAIVARELGIPYSPGAMYIFLRFGRLGAKYHGRRVLYTIYTQHGAGGGRKEGAKAIRLADMASTADADIYIHSHTHLPMIMRQVYFRCDATNNAVAPVDRLFVNTASTLDYGGYGEQYEFKPSSKSNPVIYLRGDKKHAEARL